MCILVRFITSRLQRLVTLLELILELDKVWRWRRSVTWMFVSEHVTDTLSPQKRLSLVFEPNKLSRLWSPWQCVSAAPCQRDNLTAAPSTLVGKAGNGVRVPAWHEFLEINTLEVNVSRSKRFNSAVFLLYHGKLSQKRLQNY